MKTKRTLLMLMLLASIAFRAMATQPKELPELKKIFDKYQVNGSILIYNQNEKSFSGYNLERCSHPFCPASTFKIPNTLIAIESGVATAETMFKWNGDKRAFPTWEKDMTLKEAFKLSSVPVYQEIARRVGVERMRHYTSLFAYGNLDITPQNIDKFWLEGKSAITQFQQIYFLQKLYNLELPVRTESMQMVKQIMQFEVGKNYTISAKTGWAVRQNENIMWFVGYVESNNNVYYFATNVAADEHSDLKTFGQKRIELTKEVLRELKIIIGD